MAVKRTYSQLALTLGSDHAPRTEHGGAVRSGKRKLARPFDPKRPLHLVFRSQKAKGAFSLLRLDHEQAIEKLLGRLARKFHIRIYRFANSGSHLHLLVRAKRKDQFQAFVRSFGGQVARFVSGAKKGRRTGKFWDGLFYSRLVNWGRAFFQAKYYVVQNELEALGLYSRKWHAPKVARLRP